MTLAWRPRLRNNWSFYVRRPNLGSVWRRRNLENQEVADRSNSCGISCQKKQPLPPHFFFRFLMLVQGKKNSLRKILEELSRKFFCIQTVSEENHRNSKTSNSCGKFFPVAPNSCDFPAYPNGALLLRRSWRHGNTVLTQISRKRILSRSIKSPSLSMCDLQPTLISA
jgi:hypothetical protein